MHFRVTSLLQSSQSTVHELESLPRSLSLFLSLEIHFKNMIYSIWRAMFTVALPWCIFRNRTCMQMQHQWNTQWCWELCIIMLHKDVNMIFSKQMKCIVYVRKTTSLVFTLLQNSFVVIHDDDDDDEIKSSSNCTSYGHTQRCVRIHSFDGAGCDLKITWWWMVTWMNGKYRHDKNERTMKRPVEGLKSMWRWNESEKEEEENRQFSFINFIAVSAKFSYKLAFNRLTYVFSPHFFQRISKLNSEYNSKHKNTNKLV